jgi:pimeloyl-ACP methyl ester carboxylesterase
MKLALSLLVASLMTLMTGAVTASAQDLPRGQIVDAVQCLDDPSQRYALYLPSNFTPERRWPVIFAFDAGGRGLRPVERYQAAAEQYGYIVVGSNNSRNGPVAVSSTAASAMRADVEKRFPIDPRRIYTAGMSGGARVAMRMGLRWEAVAGVFASSGGFPDRFYETVPFPVFFSAGTDDFNYLEMRNLDRRIKSPHRLQIFDGGHTWLPVAMALDAVEWMELQAMAKGLRPRDQTLVDAIFAKRVARAEAETRPLQKVYELRSIAADFQPFKEVTTFAERAMALERQPELHAATGAERADEDREMTALDNLYELRDWIGVGAFGALKEKVTKLIEEANAPADSQTRRIARRVLALFATGSRDEPYPELQDLLKQIRPVQ